MVALPGELELHVPPGEGSVSAVTAPSQIVAVPEIGDGVGFTVTVAVTKQPVPRIYDTVVMPAITPVNTPELLIVATEVELLLQVPPVVKLLSVIVVPLQTNVGPIMATGFGLTVKA